MEIKRKACGVYATNCYIVSLGEGELIIDPGQDAASWVLNEVKNPIAILNTHGHFDHIWSNKMLSETLQIPIYAPEGDCFMLEADPFLQGTPSSKADVSVKGDERFMLGGVEVSFLHFPGHTPGCSAILINDTLFSGDFIFKNSIGRYDFPYSDEHQMRESLEKFLKIDADWEIYPGHGAPTTLKNEQDNVPHWLRVL